MANSPLNGGVEYDRFRPESAGGGISGWFGLPQRVNPPQEKNPWSTSWGLTLNVRFLSPAPIETLLSETENWGSQECIIEFSLQDLG